MTLADDCEAKAAVMVAGSAEIGTGPRYPALLPAVAGLELAGFELATVVKPESPNEAVLPLTAYDAVDAELPLAIPTDGDAVGGDRIGVPGPTLGTCHAVPPGKTVIGMVDELLVP